MVLIYLQAFPLQKGVSFIQKERQSKFDKHSPSKQKESYRQSLEAKELTHLQRQLVKTEEGGDKLQAI